LPFNYALDWWLTLNRWLITIQQGDRIPDITTLADYLDSQGAGTLLKAVMTKEVLEPYLPKSQKSRLVLEEN